MQRDRGLKIRQQGKRKQRRRKDTQYARTDVWKYSFAVRVIAKWNRLPESVKTAQDKEAFMRGLLQTKNRAKNKTKIRRKQGRERKESKKSKWQMESHKDPTEMNISTIMAYRR